MAEERASRPTVLVLASTYPRWRGDVEPGFVHELCRRLADRFDVIALVPDAEGADESGEMDGVGIVRYRYAPRKWQTLVYSGGIGNNLRRSKWKYLLLPTFIGMQWLAMRRILRERRVDAIHAHWLIPQGWVARMAPAIPFLVTSHGGDLFGLQSKPLQWLKRTVARSCAAMTVVSSAMAEEARRIGLEPPRIEVLPMGVDLRERFVPDPSVERDRDALLAVGRLVPKKGLDLLLDAMPAIVQARPAVRLDIAGFGPQEAALRAQAERLGVAPHVNFLGAVPQAGLPALYRRASLLVAPYVRDAAGDQEGLPVVLMEAIGCGCPVVVGDVAGVDDLIGAMKAEACVDPRDTPSLADAVISALDDPAALARRAAAIREIAAERIDWDNVARGYADLLDACMSGRRQ